MRTGLLLDTSFASALSPGRPQLPDKLASWVIENDHRFHLPTVVVVEVWAGIEKLRREEKHERAAAYEQWLTATLELFGSRVLDLTIEMAEEAGRIGDAATAKGAYPGFADVAIAGTARVLGLTVLTRNAKHFEHLGIQFADPFEKLPR